MYVPTAGSTRHQTTLAGSSHGGAAQPHSRRGMLGGLGVQVAPPEAAMSSSKPDEAMGTSDMGALAARRDRSAKRQREGDEHDDKASLGRSKLACVMPERESISSSFEVTACSVASDADAESAAAAPSTTPQSAESNDEPEFNIDWDGPAELDVPPEQACAKVMRQLRADFVTYMGVPPDPLLEMAPKNRQLRLAFARLVCAEISQQRHLGSKQQADDVVAALEKVAHSLLTLHLVRDARGDPTVLRVDLSPLIRCICNLHEARAQRGSADQLADWLPFELLFPDHLSEQERALRLRMAISTTGLEDEHVSDLLQLFIRQYSPDEGDDSSAQVCLDLMTQRLENLDHFRSWHASWRKDRHECSGPLLTTLRGIADQSFHHGNEGILWRLSGRLPVRQLTALGCAIATTNEQDYQQLLAPALTKKPSLPVVGLTPRKWKYLLAALPHFPPERAVLMAACLLAAHSRSHPLGLANTTPEQAIQALSNYAHSKQGASVPRDDVRLCLLAARMVRDPRCIFDAERASAWTSLPAPIKLDEARQLGQAVTAATAPPRAVDFAALSQEPAAVSMLAEFVSIPGLFEGVAVSAEARLASDRSTPWRTAHTTTTAPIRPSDGKPDAGSRVFAQARPPGQS